MESSGGPLPHGGDVPAAVVSAKKLRRAVRAVYLGLFKKHQPKLAALGVHLHRLLSYKREAREHSALATSLLSSLSCRSMDPAAAVVHPLPRDHGGHRLRKSSSGASLSSSLSCRTMDPALAVCQYQYRPREVQFSCKSTPPRARRRARRLQQGVADQGRERERDHHQSSLELEYHGSAAAVTRLFELLDVEEEAAGVVDFDDDRDLLDLESAAAWPALSVGPAPRQVWITDSPFPAREDDDDRMVDKRADEFITWFHEQLRTEQQPRATARERGAGAYYWVG